MLAALFTLFVIFLYGPMIAIFILSFQGPTGGAGLSAARRVADLVRRAVRPGAGPATSVGAFSRSLPLALIVLVLTVLISVTAGFAFRRRFRGSTAIFYTAIASLIVPGLVLSIGILVTFRYPRPAGALVRLGARRASLLDAAVRASDHVRRARPAQPVLRGGGLRSRRQPLAGGQGTWSCRSSFPA